jgi:hypothetical protein
VRPFSGAATSKYRRPNGLDEKLVRLRASTPKGDSKPSTEIERFHQIRRLRKSWRNGREGVGGK